MENNENGNTYPVNKEGGIFYLPALYPNWYSSSIDSVPRDFYMLIKIINSSIDKNRHISTIFNWNEIIFFHGADPLKI